MIHATYQDRKAVIEILTRSFQANPTLMAMSRMVNGRHNIKPILEYAFKYSMRRKGVFLSEDKTSVAFLNYEFGNRFRFSEILDKLMLVIKTIPLQSMPAILEHLSTIRKVKTTKEPFLHFWFLGSNCQSSVHSTRRFMMDLFEMASAQNMTIFAETTIPKNHRVFERFGFETYSVIENSVLKLKVFCMKKK